MILIICLDSPAHLFSQCPGDGEPQSCGTGGSGIHSIEPVKQTAGLDFIQLSCVVGEDDLPVFTQGDIQVAVAVFYGVAEQIPEDPGAGVPVENTFYFCFIASARSRMIRIYRLASPVFFSFSRRSR